MEEEAVARGVDSILSLSLICLLVHYSGIGDRSVTVAGGLVSSWLYREQARDRC
jgi:hypothetical protein